MEVKILNHPIVKHNLSIIRDKNSDCERFKNALKRITYSLIYEATTMLPTVNKTIETPLCETTCEVFDNRAQLIIAPILASPSFTSLWELICDWLNITL